MQTPQLLHLFSLCKGGQLFLCCSTGHSTIRTCTTHRQVIDIFFYASLHKRYTYVSLCILQCQSLSPSAGCHLFCTSELDARYLRVVVAAKNKINMLVWRHHTAGFSLLTPSSPITPPSPLTPSPPTPSVPSSSTEGFIKHRVSPTKNLHYYNVHFPRISTMLEISTSPKQLMMT